MKRIFIFLSLSFFLTACKKDNSSGIVEELLLAGVSQNGKTQREYFYTTDKELIRMNNYLNSSLSGYTIYEYENGDIRRSFNYNPTTHNVGSKREYTLDNFKRLIRTEVYFPVNPDQLNSVVELTYNAKGLATIRWKNEDNETNFLDEFLYDDNGNLSQVIRTTHPNQPDEYKDYEITYTYGSRRIPAHWRAYEFATTGTDLQVLDMYYESKESKFWDENGQLTIHNKIQPSDRKYNSQGYLTSQVLTTTYTVPAAQAPNVNEKTYEYTK